MRLSLAALACAAFLLPACSEDGHLCVLGYTTKPNYNTDYHTVRVPIFENRTFRQRLEFELTEEVVRQINLKTPYRVVDCTKDADTELTGVITTTGKSILNRNQLNEIREAETTLVVELTWRDLKTGDILSRPRREGANVQTPGQPILVPGGPEGEILVPPPPPPPGEKPTVSGVVIARSLAHYIPEVGESITTAYQKNVQRLATQIVSLMEAPW